MLDEGRLFRVDVQWVQHQPDHHERISGFGDYAGGRTQRRRHHDGHPRRRAMEPRGGVAGELRAQAPQGGWILLLHRGPEGGQKLSIHSTRSAAVANVCHQAPGRQRCWFCRVGGALYFGRHWRCFREVVTLERVRPPFRCVEDSEQVPKIHG